MCPWYHLEEVVGISVWKKNKPAQTSDGVFMWCYKFGFVPWRAFGSSGFNFHWMLLYCPEESGLFRTSVKEQIKRACPLHGHRRPPWVWGSCSSVIPPSPHGLLKQNLEVAFFAEKLSTCNTCWVTEALPLLRLWAKTSPELMHGPSCSTKLQSKGFPKCLIPVSTVMECKTQNP